MDGEGIDVWVGSGEKKIDAIMKEKNNEKENNNI